MNLACSGAGILAINSAAVWYQTSTTADASDGELHKTIQPPSLKGNIISRPLKCMEIYENNYTDPMNMDALDFDGDMWDPEYCDSELRAVEASGESRDELCPCQQTQLKLNRRLTGGTRVTSAWQWPSDAVDKKCCWDYPYIMLDFIQTSDVLPNPSL